MQTAYQICSYNNSWSNYYNKKCISNLCPRLATPSILMAQDKVKFLVQSCQFKTKKKKLKKKRNLVRDWESKLQPMLTGRKNPSPTWLVKKSNFWKLTWKDLFLELNFKNEFIKKIWPIWDRCYSTHTLSLIIIRARVSSFA